MQSQPSLRMWFSDFAHLPSLVVPEPYTMRLYASGDERLWCELLQANGELGEWNAERAQKVFAQANGRVWKESIHFLERDTGDGRQAVATACIQLHDDQPRVPELGWVAVLPEERGKGLGRIISLGVLHYMASRGFERCFLLTNDWRLPAIKTYLKLGFTPDMSHESYPARWAAVKQALFSGTQ